MTAAFRMADASLQETLIYSKEGASMGLKPVVFPIAARPKAKVQRVDEKNSAEPPLFNAAAVSSIQQLE